VRRSEVDTLGFEDGGRVEVRLQLDRYYAVLAGTFADTAPGELILYEDSSGLMTLAISQGNAARLTGVRPGDRLRIART
jgi:S-adenosylmethionine hydrolase